MLQISASLVSLSTIHIYLENCLKHLDLKLTNIFLDWFELDSTRQVYLKYFHYHQYLEQVYHFHMEFD